MKTLICQRWEESERGFGTRPIGYSLHKTSADAIAFANAFMKKQYEELGEEVPDEYDRPYSFPYACNVETEDLDRIIYDNRYAPEPL